MTRYILVFSLLAFILISTNTVDARHRNRERRSYTPPPVQPPPAPKPPTTTPAPSNELRYIAYLTGYGYPDNDPPNSNTTWNSGIGGKAGGTGTYNDPITLAVGYVGQISDFPYHTKFYIPNVRAYFEVEDTCASCHPGKNGKVWLDQWVGGVGQSASATLNCEAKLTGNHLVIQNPAPNYPVITGSLFDGTCRQEFGDAI